MNQKVLIITGMHRTGTSLITQWLNRCGLFVGDRLLPAGTGNDDGHFEDLDFLELHVKILKKRKLPASGFISGDVEDLNAVEKVELKALIERKKSERHEWGWKEPRTCLFLDIYHEMLPAANYLIIVRDYNSTVNSMLARHYKFQIEKFKTKKGLSKLKWVLFRKMTAEQVYRKYAGKYLATWIYYYEKILHHLHLTAPENFLVIDLKSLLQFDEYIFNRLSVQWNFSLQYVPFTDVYKKTLVSDVKDIDQYIADASLLIKARKIEKIISPFCVLRNI